MFSTHHISSDLRNAWLLVAAGAVCRLVFAGLLPLVADETNYWQWSRYLAAGYHDQAPMIAWLIRLSTTFLGHTEVAVRLPSVAALTVASGYMVAMAARWFGDRAAFNTALISQGILAFVVGGILATADGIQAAAWAGATYHVARGYEENTWRHWIAGGLWFGFGMLSKYTMVIFLAGAFLYGLFSSSHRQRLWQWRPYVSVLLGSTMFFPVIWWNAQNNWSSLRHVAYIGGANEAVTVHWNFVGDYLGSQAGFLTPLVFILVVMAWTAAIRRKPPADTWISRYLVFTSLIMIGGFALLSLHSRVYGNWPMAGYIPAGVLAASLYGRRRAPDGGRQRTSRLWPWAVGSTYVISVAVLLHAVWAILPVPRHLDMIANEIPGWNLLGKRVQTVHAAMPDPSRTFIFGMKYQVASELAFYVPDNPRTVSINRFDRPNVYDYWWEDADLIGMDAVGVTEGSQSHLRELPQVFDRVDPPIPLDIRSRDGAAIIRTFYLYRAYGFKGGLRWRPPHARDIRAGG